MQFFESMAAITTTSIADVECKHALAKHWADRPFPTMVAKHINSEFRSAKLDAQTTTSKQLCMEGKLPGCSESKASIMVQVKEKQIRSKSSYMFFRDDYIRSQKALGNTVNPASKGFWAELKVAFNSLTSDMRAFYDSMAATSSEDARQKRRDKKRDQQQLTAESNSSEVAVSNLKVVVYNPG